VTRMQAKDMPVGTEIEIPSERITLHLAYGRKPWRQPAGRLRFSHAEVQASLDAGEAEVVRYGDQAVAAI
jgi:hypothetical protein